MKNFKDLLSIAIGASLRKAVIPAYTWVKVESKDGVLSVSCFNGEMQITSKSESDEEFLFCCDSFKLNDVLRAMPDEFNLKVTDKNIIISKGKTRFQIKIEKVEEFPSMNEIDAKSFSMDAEEFKYGLTRTVKSMPAQPDVRYMLNGLHLNFRDGHMVSTDGHRLSMFEIEKIEADSVIIPKKAALEIDKIIGDEMLVKVGGGNMSISFGNTSIQIKLIDGVYVNYQAAIPGDGVQAVSDAKMMKATLKRINAIATAKTKPVKLAFEPGFINMLAHNDNREEAEDQLACSYSGEPFEVGYNSLYMLDAIDGLDGEVVMTVKDENTAMKIQHGDKETHVVMPMRL